MMQIPLSTLVQRAKCKGIFLRNINFLYPLFLKFNSLMCGDLNFMGPFVSSFGNQYILVAVDYVSK